MRCRIVAHGLAHNIHAVLATGRDSAGGSKIPRVQLELIHDGPIRAGAGGPAHDPLPVYRAVGRGIKAPSDCVKVAPAIHPKTVRPRVKPALMVRHLKFVHRLPAESFVAINHAFAHKPALA